MSICICIVEYKVYPSLSSNDIHMSLHNISLHMLMYMYVSMGMCVCMWICVCVNGYVCVYVFFGYWITTSLLHNIRDSRQAAHMQLPYFCIVFHHVVEGHDWLKRFHSLVLFGLLQLVLFRLRPQLALGKASCMHPLCVHVCLELLPLQVRSSLHLLPWHLKRDLHGKVHLTENEV